MVFSVEIRGSKLAPSAILRWFQTARLRPERRSSIGLAVGMPGERRCDTSLEGCVSLTKDEGYGASQLRSFAASIASSESVCGSNRASKVTGQSISARD